MELSDSMCYTLGSICQWWLNNNDSILTVVIIKMKTIIK